MRWQAHLLSIVVPSHVLRNLLVVCVGDGRSIPEQKHVGVVLVLRGRLNYSSNSYDV